MSPLKLENDISFNAADKMAAKTLERSNHPLEIYFYDNALLKGKYKEKLC